MRISFAVVGLTLAIGCSPTPTPETTAPGVPVSPGAASGYNLLIVTLDTVRADHLGVYGHDAAETPNLDGLAARGTRFTDAITPSPSPCPRTRRCSRDSYPLAMESG